MNRKKIAGTIGLVLVATLAVGLYKASTLQSLKITSSVNINATKEEVFDMVRFQKNFPKWSPFYAQDPTQKYEVRNTDGAVGARYYWEGNEGKDLGYQEIVKIDTFSFIGIKCNIEKPFVAKPNFDYSFTETPDGILVRQEFKLESGLTDAIFMWLFGVKEVMESTNLQGLKLLKKVVEAK